MENPIINIHHLGARTLDIDPLEVLRYLGCAATPPPELLALAEESIAQLSSVLNCRACWTRLPLIVEPKTLEFGHIVVTSRDLGRQLRRCREVILFAATIGLEAERLISRSARLNPSRGVALDAAGSAAIEAYCDLLCDEFAAMLQNEGYTLKPRFSPGYGDVDLSLQREFFSLLDCERKIGLTLSESLLMIPSKSVSAIVGVIDGSVPEKKKDCANCAKLDCAFRKG